MMIMIMNQGWNNNNDNDNENDMEQQPMLFSGLHGALLSVPSDLTLIPQKDKDLR